MGMAKDWTIGVREERVRAVRRFCHPCSGGDDGRTQEGGPVQVPSVREVLQD